MITHAILQGWIGKWVIVTPACTIHGMEQIVGRLRDVGEHEILLDAAGLSIILNLTHLVALTLPTEQDTLTLESMAQTSAKKE